MTTGTTPPNSEQASSPFNINDLGIKDHSDLPGGYRYSGGVPTPLTPKPTLRADGAAENARHEGIEVTPDGFFRIPQ